jgi:hypothetical protein
VAIEEGDVTVLGLEAELGSRHAGGEPFGMRDGNDVVLLSQPDRHRRRDPGEVEAPVAEEGEVVVDPTVDPVTYRERKGLG